MKVVFRIFLLIIIVDQVSLFIYNLYTEVRLFLLRIGRFSQMGNALVFSRVTSDSENKTIAQTRNQSPGLTYFGWTRGSSWKVTAADAKEDDDDDLEDPVERMLKKTGCLEKHYSVQECIAETKDWRQCQQQVQEFKECMKVYKKKPSKIFV